MDKLINLFKTDLERVASYAPRLLAALLVLYISYLAGKYLSRLVLNLLRRTSIQDIHATFFRIVTTGIGLFLGLIIALHILGLEKLAISVLAGGGVTAVILGFAFREIGENFLAGLFLAFSRPFKIGDVIQTEDIQGKVMDIEIRYTHLRSEDGKDVYVPSAQLFNRPLTNFTRDGFLRLSFDVGIDFTHDLKAACSALKQQ